MRKLLYLVTEDWFFVSHFLPMARTAKAAGFEVVVATRVRDHAARIEAEGCRVVSLENERRSVGAGEAVRSGARAVLQATTWCSSVSSAAVLCSLGVSEAARWCIHSAAIRSRCAIHSRAPTSGLASRGYPAPPSGAYGCN